MSALAPVRPTGRTASATARVQAKPGLPGAAAQGRAQPRRQEQQRPQLRVVDAPRAVASRLPFALLVAGTLASGLVVLLMLHTLAAQDAFRLHRLQRQAASLADVEQQLSLADQQAQAPSMLATKARALGMVATGSLHVVRHKDGRVVGVLTAVPAPAPKPAATATPTPTASASAGASPNASPSPSPKASAALKPTHKSAHKPH